MKISKKRFEEILLEEVKVFAQENKLEEEKYYTDADGKQQVRPKKGSDAYKLKKAEHEAKKDAGWSWDEHEKLAGEESSWFGKLFRALSETNEGCGDMPAPKKTIKIKIKQQSIFCLDGALKTSYIPNGNEI